MMETVAMVVEAIAMSSLTSAMMQMGSIYVFTFLFFFSPAVLSLY